MRGNITMEERRSKDIRKLYPYLNCTKASPKKRKDIISFIEHKLMKIERNDHRKLKRVQLARNAPQDEP